MVSPKSLSKSKKRKRTEKLPSPSSPRTISLQEGDAITDQEMVSPKTLSKSQKRRRTEKLPSPSSPRIRGVQEVDANTDQEMVSPKSLSKSNKSKKPKRTEKLPSPSSPRITGVQEGDANTDHEMVSPKSLSKSKLSKSKKPKRTEKLPSPSSPRTRTRGGVQEGDANTDHLQIPVSQTLFVGNVSSTVKKKDVREFFKDCGEIIRIRFAKDDESKFMGFLHVDFTTEAAAKQGFTKNNEIWKGRRVMCNINLGPDHKEFEGNIVLVEEFPFTGTDETRKSLERQFEQCGVVKEVFLPKHLNGPEKNGTAFIAFENKEDLTRALAVTGESGLSVSVPQYPKILNQCGYEGGYGGVYGYAIDTGKKKKSAGQKWVQGQSTTSDDEALGYGEDYES